MKYTTTFMMMHMYTELVTNILLVQANLRVPIIKDCSIFY